MKNLNLNRLLILIPIFIFAGFSIAAANGFTGESDQEQKDLVMSAMNTPEIDDIFCINNDPSRVIIIIDQYDRIVTQGNCRDVMVQFFLKISDPLFQLDNTKYFRIGYDNPEMIEQRLHLNTIKQCKNEDIFL